MDWPAEVTSTEISVELRGAIPDFEPSGIVWHRGRQTFIVVGDGGDIGEITASGGLVHAWSPGHNLESVTIADPTGSIVYVGGENESMIYAFDLDSGAYTGATWDISAYIYSVGMLGFEALTWVPDGAHAFGSTVSGGVFYAGWQEDADIYVFAPDLGTSGAITFLDQIHTTADYIDLSALNYNEATNTVFALYDAADRLEELSAADGAVIATYAVPGPGAWEGLATLDGCPDSPMGTMTLADDFGRIFTYASFPYSCLIQDYDGDGVNSDVDCDDGDSSIISDATYYPDADGDGFGAPTGAVKQCGPPDGYVADATDCDDALAAINPAAQEICDAADTDEDCDGLADDADDSVSGQSPFFEDADGDGVGSEVTVSACESGSGYAWESGDCDDADADDYPGATEIIGNADDEDCDGAEVCFWDGDGDGLRPDASPYLASADADCSDVGEATADADTTDCDDGDAKVHPGAEDAPGDGVDSDCDGVELAGENCGCAAGGERPVGLAVIALAMLWYRRRLRPVALRTTEPAEV